MFRILTVIIVCFLFCGNIYAQESKSYFYITGKIKVDQGFVDGTKIQISRDEALLNTVTVNRTGNFRVKIDLNHIYRFHFNNDAYYAKTVEVDAHIPSNVCDQNCIFPPYQLALMLFKKVPGVIETNSEIGRISYNPKVDNFDAEMLRNNSSMENEMSSVLTTVKSASQKYEQQKVKKKKDEYREAIAEADRLYKAKNYEIAMQRYRDAVLIFPHIVYARNRVNQLYSILVAKQVQSVLGAVVEENFLKYVNYGDRKFDEREYTVAKVSYQMALQIKPDEISLKNKLYNCNQEYKKLQELALEEVNHNQSVYEARKQKYDELIKNGNVSFEEEDLAKAKDYFAQAATQIKENSYAMLMIGKIEDLYSNDDASLKLAREREAAEKERLKIARNRAYNDAISEADRMFDQRLYRDAIEYFELALTIKSFEPYPQKQIYLIKKILAKLQLQGESYNDYIRKADAAYYNKEYKIARAMYVQAHELISDEQYALHKIETIDHILQNSKNANEIDSKFSNFIKTADQLLGKQLFEKALSVYQQASKLKPTESYPRSQIKKIREILSRENDEQKRLLQLQNSYDEVIVKADNAFNQQSYTSARSFYQKALQILSGQEYPLSQLDKIDRILKEKERINVTKSKLEQIDFSNLENVSEEDREAAYNEAMALGESFIKSKEWGIARFYFRRALALYSHDESATNKLAFVDQKIRGDNVNESKFNEMIKKADEAFKSGDFAVAKFYYSKAKEANPNDEYVQERISVVNRLAETTASRASNREFDAALKKANDAFSAKNYSVARFFYRKALSLKPKDSIATQKLSDVEALINSN